MNDLKHGVGEIKSDVADMQAGFRSDRASMANKTRAERQTSISDINKSVADLRQRIAGLRKEFAHDIAGAGAAWSGSAPTKRRATEKIDRRYDEAVRRGQKRR